MITQPRLEDLQQRLRERERLLVSLAGVFSALAVGVPLSRETLQRVVEKITSTLR